MHIKLLNILNSSINPLLIHLNWIVTYHLNCQYYDKISLHLRSIWR